MGCFSLNGRADIDNRPFTYRTEESSRNGFRDFKALLFGIGNELEISSYSSLKKVFCVRIINRVFTNLTSL